MAGDFSLLLFYKLAEWELYAHGTKQVLALKYTLNMSFIRIIINFLCDFNSVIVLVSVLRF